MIQKIIVITLVLGSQNSAEHSRREDGILVGVHWVFVSCFTALNSASDRTVNTKHIFQRNFYLPNCSLFSMKFSKIANGIWSSSILRNTRMVVSFKTSEPTWKDRAVGRTVCLYWCCWWLPPACSKNHVLHSSQSCSPGHSTIVALSYLETVIRLSRRFQWIFNDF